MPKLRLTDLTLQSLKVPDTYWDELLPAFGVRVGKNRKTFIVMRGKSRIRMSLGRYPDTSLLKARQRAKDIISGIEPQSEINCPTQASDAVKHYLSSIQVRPRTKNEYERLLKTHFLPVLGHRRLVDITARDILAVTDKLAATPTERLHAHVAMSIFFNHCVRRMMIPVSPMLPLKHPSKSNVRDRLLTDNEIQRLWHATDHAPYGYLVRLCILTGQRKLECASMRLSMVSDGVLTLPKELCKNRVEHRFPISDMALDILRSEAHFPFNGWSKSKTRLDQLTGVTDWVLHDTRRYFSSTMARLGVSIVTTEALLNHVTGSRSSLQRIDDRYDRQAEMRDAISRFEDHVRRTIA